MDAARGACFWAGLVNIVFGTDIVFIILIIEDRLKVQALGLLALAVMAVAAIAASFGLTAVAQHLGAHRRHSARAQV